MDFVLVCELRARSAAGTPLTPSADTPPLLAAVARCTDTSEAHASDEWPVGNPVVLKQHTTLDERRAAASRFVAEKQWPGAWPVAVDAIDNPTDRLLALWPVRAYVILDGVVRFKAMAANYTYTLEPLMAALAPLVGADADA